MFLALTLLAFTMTPPLWALALVLSVALSAGLTTYFHLKKMEKAERVTHAAFAGLRAGIKDLSLGKDEVLALEDSIRAAADDWGVTAHVDQHLGEGLAPSVTS